MTISIFADVETSGPRATRPHEAPVTRDEARAVVEAIAALPDADEVSHLVFRGDCQFGWCASSVHPDRLLAIVAALGGGLAAKLGPLLSRAVEERWTLLVEDGSEWMREPMVSLGCDKVGEVNASWCSGNAVSAFAAVGYALDARHGLAVPAGELRDRCRGSVDAYVRHLGAIAAYALASLGPEALVRAG